MGGYWHQLHKQTKRVKQQRIQRYADKIPIIKEFCRHYNIEIRKTEHGYQFRAGEYVLNWSPSTNNIGIQYRLPGHNKTIRFMQAGQPGKPRIIVALEELRSIVRL